MSAGVGVVVWAGAGAEWFEMTEEEIKALTREERARLEAAEQEALSILKRTVNDGPRPQRHLRFALVAFAFVAALSLVVLGIAWIVSLF